MDINEVLKEYNSVIVRASRKFPIEEQEDVAQEIRLWLWEALAEYDQYKDQYPLFIYIRNQIGFCLRRLYFDTKRQEVFERSHLPYIGPTVNHQNPLEAFDESEVSDYTEEYVQEIVKELTPKDQVVFFALIHDNKNRNYKQLSEMLRLEYSSFRNSVGKIKKITKKVFEL